MADLFEAAGLTPHAPSPLADRLRPQTLGEVVGQDHLLGGDGPIGRMAQAHRLASMILWGPPGTGKTLLARAVAAQARAAFFSVSPSSLLSKFVGESEKVAKAVYDCARARAPA